MIGRFLGKVAALPVRIANLPVFIGSKIADSDGDGDELGGVSAADSIEDFIAEALGDEDDE